MSPIETPKDPDSNAISLADFDLIRVIGRGSYAKVLMVELKKTKRIYAMKVIKKELVTDDEVSFFSLLDNEHNYLVGCYIQKFLLKILWNWRVYFNPIRK